MTLFTSPVLAAASIACEAARKSFALRLNRSFCVQMSGFAPHIFVDISGQVAIKERMLALHRSQLERSGDRDFAPLAELMRLQCQTRGAQAGVAAAEAFRPHDAFKRIGAW